MQKWFLVFLIGRKVAGWKLDNYFILRGLFKQHRTQHCCTDRIVSITDLKANTEELHCCTRNLKKIWKWGSISTICNGWQLINPNVEFVGTCVYCPNAVTFTKAPPRYYRFRPQGQQPLWKTPGFPEESSSWVVTIRRCEKTFSALKPLTHCASFGQSQTKYY